MSDVGAGLMNIFKKELDPEYYGEHISVFKTTKQNK